MQVYFGGQNRLVLVIKNCLSVEFYTVQHAESAFFLRCLLQYHRAMSFYIAAISGQPNSDPCY